MLGKGPSKHPPPLSPCMTNFKKDIYSQLIQLHHSGGGIEIMKVKPDCDDCGGLCSIAGGFVLKTAHCSLI